MEDKDLLEKIKKLSDKEEQAELKELYDTVLRAFLVYQKTQFDQIKTQLKEELPIVRNQWAIYTTVIDKETYKEKNKWLYPVIKEEIDEEEVDWKLVKICAMAGQKVIVDRIFLKSSYDQVKEIFQDEKLYEGILITDKRNIRVQVQLQRYEPYQNKLEKVRMLYRKNKVEWYSVMEAYYNRFASVVLVSVNGKIEETEEIRGIKINFEEITGYIHKNKILLWNLEETYQQTNGFPTPQIDYKAYEYPIFNSKEQPVLVDLKSVEDYVVRETNGIKIISAKSDIHKWNVIKVHPFETLDSDMEFPLLGNKVSEQFSNRYVLYHGKSELTRGEIERCIHSLGMDEYVYLEKVDWKEEGKLNFFIRGTEKERWLHKDISNYIKNVFSNRYTDWTIQVNLL